MGDYYLPMLGTVRNLKVNNIRFKEDKNMYYLKDRREEDKRICIQ